MIANFFHKTKPVHSFFISGLFFVYFLLSIFIVEKPEFSFLLILQKLGFLFVFIVFFFLVRFVNRKNYLSGQDGYVLLILAMLFGMFPRAMEINNLFVSLFFLLLAMRRIYSIRTFKNVKQKLFDSGLWIGVAALFYMWSSIFLGLIFLAVFVHKRQEIRNLIIPIVGFITPIFLAFTYYFVTDDISSFYNRLIFEYSLSFDNYFAINLWLPIIILFILSIIGIAIVSIKIYSLTNDLKPSWALILAHFFIAIYIIIFSPIKDGSEMLFIFFPISIIIANNLQLINKRVFREILVYGLLALSFSVYFL